MIETPPKNREVQQSTAALIRSDLRAMIPDGDAGRGRFFLTAVVKFLLYPRIRAVVYYRLAHHFYRRRAAPLAYWFQQRGLRSAGAEIHPAAVIGPGFCLFHSSGVVIGDRVVVGRDLKCFQGVTLGDSGGAKPGQPTVGNEVSLFAGAKLLGPIRVGDGAVIGANAVVLIDVPAAAVAVGIPAKIVPR